jgi:hypothetical protein
MTSGVQHSRLNARVRQTPSTSCYRSILVSCQPTAEETLLLTWTFSSKDRYHTFLVRNLFVTTGLAYSSLILIDVMMSQRSFIRATERTTRPEKSNGASRIPLWSKLFARSGLVVVYVDRSGQEEFPIDHVAGFGRQAEQCHVDRVVLGAEEMFSLEGYISTRATYMFVDIWSCTDSLCVTPSMSSSRRTRLWKNSIVCQAW